MEDPAYRSHTHGHDGSDDRLKCYSFLMGTDRYIVFLVDDPGEAPPERVRDELEMLANLAQDKPVRGPGTTLAVMALSGIVGGAAWAATASALVATKNYISRLIDKRKRIENPNDATVRLREVWDHLDHHAAGPLHSIKPERTSDGTWSATFSYQASTVTARLDPTGSVIDLEIARNNDQNEHNPPRQAAG